MKKIRPFLSKFIFLLSAVFMLCFALYAQPYVKNSAASADLPFVISHESGIPCGSASLLSGMRLSIIPQMAPNLPVFLLHPYDTNALSR